MVLPPQDIINELWPRKLITRSPFAVLIVSVSIVPPCKTSVDVDKNKRKLHRPHEWIFLQRRTPKRLTTTIQSLCGHRACISTARPGHSATDGRRYSCSGCSVLPPAPDTDTSDTI